MADEPDRTTTTKRGSNRPRLIASVERYEDTPIIGAPENGRAIYVTNSERGSWTCPRRGYFRHVEGLRGQRTRPLSYGTAWHEIVGDVYRHWQETDAPYPDDGEYCCRQCRGVPLADLATHCVLCHGTGLGPLARLRESYAVQAAAAEFPEQRDELLRDAEILTRATEGWFRTYGRKPFQSVRVVGVEVSVARPVLVPGTTRAYTPETYVVVTSDGIRLATTGEASGQRAVDGRVIVVRWPYYQIGRLDCVLQHRSTGVLYVGEWKSSESPADIARSLAVDPQTTGYCWLLQSALEADAFPLNDGEHRIAGVWFDAAYNGMQYDPEPLEPKPVKVLGPDGEPLRKGKRYVYEVDASGEQVLRPALSTAKNRTVPSWRFAAALAAAGIDPSGYDDHMQHLAASVDPRLYHREELGVPEDDLERYAEELYGFCVQHAAWRRAAARARTQVDLNVAFPRQPVCRLTGGRCEFMGPCLRDGAEIREKFAVRDGQRWTPEAVPGQEVIEW